MPRGETIKDIPVPSPAEKHDQRTFLAGQDQRPIKPDYKAAIANTACQKQNPSRKTFLIILRCPTRMAEFHSMRDFLRPLWAVAK
jgi:hypothetical protein